MALQDQIYAKQRQALIGQQVEVLVEKRSRKNPAHLKGRTRCWKSVLFASEKDLIGTLQKVTVHGYSSQTLLAELS